MITKVQKWGNSLGVRIPKAVAQHVHVTEGMAIDIREDGDQLILTPIEDVEYSLDELLQDVKKSNLHQEIEIEEPLGKEIW